MPFFPPSLNANNRAYITDAKHLADEGSSRFAAYDLPCVIYWPWLSWNEEDVSIDVEQQAIARCCLIGEGPVKVYGLVPDLIGSIIRFGDAENFQRWEVIHYFDWYDPNDAVKKFTMVWARLWDNSAAPVPIEPYLICDGSPVIDPDVTYICEDPGTFAVTNWFQFECTPSALHHIIFEIISGDAGATITVESNDCVTLLLVTGPHAPGCYEFTGPFVGLPTCFVKITFTAAVEYTVRWGLGACPP